MRLGLIFLVLALTITGYLTTFESCVVWGVCKLMFYRLTPSFWLIFTILFIVNFIFFGASFYTTFFKE